MVKISEKLQKKPPEGGGEKTEFVFSIPHIA
jgi:hypothetical protein